MSLARRRRSALGSLLAAAALLAPAAALAQRTPPDTLRPRPDTAAVPIPPRPDSAAQDTLRRAPADSVPRDTAVTPLARAPRPASFGVGGDYVWDRDAISASGAVSLLDLLERVPGVTGYRTGWLMTPEQGALNGAFGRIRVFRDGVELDALHPRAGGVADLSRVELWALEEVAVERGAGELRVHLRSWSVERTTPFTRVDVATGEYDTNVFRGYFGRRGRRGESFQVGFENSSMRDPLFGGDGGQLALFGRLGWAAGDWSVDGVAQRTRRDQSEQDRRLDRPTLPQLEDVTNFGYLRAAYRDPFRDGLWAQVVVSAQSFAERTPLAAGAPEPTPEAPADTSRARVQYVATAGWTAGVLELSATARLRAFDGERLLSPGARVGVGRGRLEAQLFAERAAEDSSSRLDAEVRLTPASRVAATLAASLRRPDEATGRETVTAGRAEVGLRLGRTWLVGGATATRGEGSGAPVVFDRELASVPLGTLAGVYGGIRGPLWRDVSVDVLGTYWSDGDSPLAYRPRQQARAQLTLDTRWLSRFPSGEFGFKASGLVEYRSAVRFPLAGGEPLEAVSSTILGGQIEIRIQDGIAFLQARNPLALQYEQVPGFLMPRSVLIYGVRWLFWN